MEPSGWIALAALTFAILVQAAASIWWAASTSASVKALQEKANEHGNLRDIVIEMRTEMRGFRDAIRELAEGLKEARAPRSRSRGEGG